MNKSFDIELNTESFDGDSLLKFKIRLFAFLTYVLFLFSE